MFLVDDDPGALDRLKRDFMRRYSADHEGYRRHLSGPGPGRGPFFTAAAPSLVLASAPQGVTEEGGRVLGVGPIAAASFGLR